MTVLVGALALAVPAAAAPGDPLYLSVTKTVSNPTPDPGEPFTYTVRVVCSEQSCLNARLTDDLPPELAGFDLLSASFSPAPSIIPRDVVWTVDGVPSASAPAQVTADTSLTVDFTGAVTVPTGTGLQYGQTFTALLTLQSPADLGPGTYAITNTARTEADNSEFDSDSADITITVAEQLGVDVTKAWTPASRAFEAGAPSTIALTATNASNITVDSLSLQEPTVAPDGASTLDASNPFQITDFAGFDAVTAPAGAAAVQVDAYVLSAGTWGWVDGAPVALPAALALPAGVAPGDVGGVRVTFTGADIELDAEASLELDVTQRSLHRNTGADMSLAVQQVTNEVIATVDAAGLDPASDTATAPHQIQPPSIAAIASKGFSPDRIAAGDVTEFTLVGTNNSDVGVESLTLTDRDFFTDDIAFDGFGSTFTWPAGATDATVTYYPLAGGPPVPVSLTAPDKPADILFEISGFDIEFTAATGTIAAGASAVIDVEVDTAEAVTASLSQVAVDNTVEVGVVATNGALASDDATDTLTMIRPSIDVNLTKTMLPGGPVEPGDRVVVALETRMRATSDYITVDEIVTEDAWAGDGTFWDAFDLESITGVQVPSGAGLAIEWRNAAGVWAPLTTFASQPTSFIASIDGPGIDAAIAPSTRADIVGLRYTFTSAGFAEDTTVTPYFTAYARSVLRSGAPVTAGPDASAGFPNTATASGGGDTPEGTPVGGSGGDRTSGTVSTPADSSPLQIDKTWNAAIVAAQSGQVRRTDLDWSVDEGFSEVVIEDMGDGSALADSVFDAFDLSRLRPISASSTPFSAGWFLRYDTITAIELFDGTTWTAVSPASGTQWIQNGAFVGYTLSPTERSTTEGVRITLTENAAARTAATQAGPAFDPYAPAVGTGVGASTTDRAFDLDWIVRDTRRSDGAFVTDQVVYNTATAGVVDNVVALRGTDGGGTQQVTANDTIAITNPGPSVRLTKTASPGSAMYVPDEGVDAAQFPSGTFTIVARNDSVSRASYVRVMDSPACDDTASIVLCESAGTAAAAVADPFDTGVDWLTRTGGNNPFDRFDLRDVTISVDDASEVDLGASVAWLLTYSGGTYSTQATTAAAVNAMDAAALADVVGLSVTFQGTDPATTGGTISNDNDLTIELDVRARTHVRSTGAAQDIPANVRVDVPNSAFAQSYDPVLADGDVNGDRDTDDLTLTGGDINVGAVKTIVPGALTEPTRDDPVTVTVGANQGSSPVSTLAPAEVRVTDSIDTSPEFWDRFAFAGLTSVSGPAGADQVEVAVYGPFGAGGADAWVTGAPTSFAAAAVPVAEGQFPLVEGLRLVYSRADGELFSSAVPAPTWSASATFEAVLRDTLRSDGSPIELSGTVDNTVEAIADRLNGEVSQVRTAADQVGLSLGTFELEVSKVANNGVHSAAAGQSVPFDLTFTNAGTGFLTVTELRDVLPDELVYLGDTAPVYTLDPAGTLGEPASLTVDGDDLVFTWPTGGRTMQPDETFSVRLMLELQPGLAAGERSTNTMIVTTAETLSRCGPIQSGGVVTNDWASDPTTCGATDYLTPTIGPNLFTVKGVRGAEPGAINPADPDAVCLPSLDATGGSYFRAPCAANSVIGGTDEWVLRVQNAGTTGVSDAVVFDALPAPNDRFLISGSDRGSDFRPHMLDDLATTAPAGTDIAIEVTSSADACRGTWANLETQEPCQQNGESWSGATASTDWSAVTAVRLRVDFAGTSTGALEPGEFIDITYSTTNVPAAADDPDGAPVAVPAGDVYAWNQFGVKYLDEGASTYRKISPAHVGVTLVTGALEVHKEITGIGAALAPRTMVADVSCVIEGVPVDMADFASLELTSDENYVARIDGIPVGAECVVSEHGALHTYGEIRRLADDIEVVVSQAITASEPVPDGQVATLINEYDAALAFTGADGIGRALAWVAALMVIGVALVAWARRREARRHG